MCFGVEVKYTRRDIIISELNHVFTCAYCKKDVYKKVTVCPYCTCKIGHPDCITTNKCPICEEVFDISLIKGKFLYRSSSLHKIPVK